MARARFLKWRTPRKEILKVRTRDARPIRTENPRGSQAAEPAARRRARRPGVMPPYLFGVPCRKNSPESYGSSYATRASPSDRIDPSSSGSRLALRSSLACQTRYTPMPGSRYRPAPRSVRRICVGMSLRVNILRKHLSHYVMPVTKEKIHSESSSLSKISQIFPRSRTLTQVIASDS